MDYLLRKFKFKHKSRDQRPPQMVVTSPQAMTSDGSSSDSTRFDIELADRLPAQVNHAPKTSPKRVKCKSTAEHNFIEGNRQSLHDSLHSSESSPSPSSGSTDGPQQTSNDLSVIAKSILSRPLEVKRNRFEPQIIQIRENTFAIDCLFWHNVFRAKHGSPPLILSYPLVQMAQEWANYLAHTDAFKYRNTGGVGENLMSKWTIHPDFDPPDHFTQVVWKSTAEFGIGKAHTRGGKLIVVANYRPPGNVIGQFHLNVLPRIKNNDKTADNKKKTHEWEDLYSLNDNSSTIHSQSLLDH